MGNQQRAPRGVTTGGQFVSGDALREDAGQVFGSNVDLLDDEELLDMSRNLGRRVALDQPRMSQVGHADGEDYGQDMAYRMLVARKNNLPKANADKSQKWVEKPYMASISRNYAREVASLHVHPNNRKAMAELNRLEDEYHHEHGRYMPPKMRDAEVERITMSAPPGKRPIRGWDRSMRAGQTVPLFVDGDGGEGEDSYLNPGIDTSAVSSAYDIDRSGNVVAEGSSEESWVADDFEDADRATKKQQLWHALSASREGLPAIAEGSLSPNEGRRAATTLKSEGGAALVAKRWMEGDLGDDHHAVKALMAPFGPRADYDSQQEFAMMLDEHPAFADDIWGHCISRAKR